MPRVICRESRECVVKFVIEIGENFLKLDSEYIAEIEIINNRHDAEVFVFS